MKLTKEEAQEIAKKSLAIAKKYGLPTQKKKNRKRK
ncbi:hypothetical protein J2X82_005344 [Priestia megaterium]|jgi:hypothetical protein|nr:hypothetical protein [Priestia megaterium]